MKKIGIVFDNDHYSKSAVGFAIKLNKFSNAMLTGVFVPQDQLANLWSYASGFPGADMIPLIEPEISLTIHENISHFKLACEEYKIPYTIHKDFKNFSISELIRESRFADLLIMGNHSYYMTEKDEDPNSFVTELLHHVECPIIIVPEKNIFFPQRIVFLYDGSADSVFAIKQFINLFSELSFLPATILFISDDDEEPVPEEKNIHELVSAHFKSVEIKKLNLEARRYFDAWSAEQKNVLFVSGSYARSSLSRMLRKSFINDIIVDQQHFLFIAHR